MKKLPFALLFALATACGDDDGHDHDHDALDAEGCEHLQEGPPVTRTATAAAAGAPSIDNDHMRYDVTLVAITGGNGGHVRFAATTAGSHVFFFNENVPVELTDSTGAEVPIEESTTSSTECTDIKGKHVIDLEVGTYDLSLGPTALTAVNIVVEELEGE